jgi:dienelactone hydrolase
MDMDDIGELLVHLRRLDMRSLVLSAAVSVTLATAASATTMERTHVQLGALQIPTFIVYPDDMNGKVPFMMIVHGSKSIAEKQIWDSEYAYAQEFAKIGIASVIIDLFTPRGIKDTVRDQDKIHGTRMASDTINILQKLKDNPKLDVTRAGVIGFSKGGEVALYDSLAAFYKNDAIRYKLAIAMYPYCGNFRYKPQLTSKLVLVLGEKDTYDRPKVCYRYDRYLKDNGNADVQVYTITGAEHAFDVKGPKHRSVAGQNYGNCIFMQDRDGNWTESTSHIVVATRDGLTKEAGKGRRSCMTDTVAWGYDPKAMEQAMHYVMEATKILKK